jgi:SET domain-containing protein
MKGIKLKDNHLGSGLYAEKAITKGTLVWKNRADGPAEKLYHRININDVESLPEDKKKIFIKYSYQQSDELFITPLTEEEVNLDYSNYWNHSCDPNCLPVDEDHWISIKDIKSGEQVTIDYCTFDCNKYDCIDECLCGSNNCRKVITPHDYKIEDIQKRYGPHFVPYILDKIRNNKC